MTNTTLTAIDGLLAGHATDDRNHTGCTAILCPQGFTPGIAVPGFAPGCRETELMRPESQVDTVHGLLLAGAAPSDWPLPTVSCDSCANRGTVSPCRTASSPSSRGPSSTIWT